MRAARFICLIAMVGTGLAACASTPREPARVDHRYPGARAATSSYTAMPVSCSRGYTVRRGDTLSEVAQRCGVDMRELARTNGLYEPYALDVGQTLRMPHPPMHVVQRGENLYRIGLRYNIPFQTLAAHNGIRPPYEIEVGQQIRLPQGARAVTVTEAAPSRVSSVRRDTSPAPAAAGAPSFDWPIRGAILSDFGRKPDGGRNDGINIEARTGADVRAAAAGQVVYAGSELAGYGRLVLIRHSGGFVTAYAHNSRILVREGDQVERGQVIAAAGDTGSVDRPQVHFEIRNGVNPVNPMSYLR